MKFPTFIPVSKTYLNHILDLHSLLSGGSNIATTMSMMCQIGQECATLVIATHRQHHSKYLIYSKTSFQNFK